MHEIKLPAPIILLDEFSTYENAIYYVYHKYLKDEFFNKEKRYKLKNKFIYIDMKKSSWIEDLPERYWHLITFEYNMEYSMYPCSDLEDENICKQNKERCGINLCTPSYSKYLEDRIECMYRLRRVNRINTVILLANNNDDRIKLWRKKDRNNSCDKVFIRYKDSISDYVVILLDLGKLYQFVTAYPVTHKKTRQDFDRDYKRYIENE